MMKSAKILAALAAVLVMPASVSAQSQGLAAIVNDDAITVYELHQRIKFTLAALRVPNRPDLRRRLAPQILQRLIMERLQIQEARRLKLTVSKQEIDNLIATIERRRGMRRGGFLAQVRRAGVDPRTIRDQVRATLAWRKVVARQIAPFIQVTGTEIEETASRTATNKNRVQYRFSEIYLPVDSADRDATVLRNAMQLLEQLRRGAPFRVLARQFSAASTAAVGGDRGITFEGQIEDRLLAALKKMRPGQIAGPIRTATGYYIIQLRARGTLAGGTIRRAGVSIARVGFRYPRGNAAARARAARAMAQIRTASKSCNDLITAGRKAKATFAHLVQNVNMARMSPGLRRVIQPLKPGEVSRVARTPGNMFIFMRCRARSGDLPTRAAIRRSIFLQKINTRAENYLRDLRRAAIVEIRV